MSRALVLVAALLAVATAQVGGAGGNGWVACVAVLGVARPPPPPPCLGPTAHGNKDGKKIP